MRPIYESKKDLDGEVQVAEVLGQKWGCKFIKLPIRYHLDFVITKGDMAVAYAELKVRKYSMPDIGRMGGYMISLGKWAAAKQMSEASLLPFILVVKASDGIYQYTTKTFEHDGVMVRGRTDRNDWQDVEPCVMLNVDRFKKVC